MMMNLAMELKAHNIFTTTYCPGGVASGMKANNGRYRPKKFGGPEPVAEVQFSGEDRTHSSMAFYRPEAVAPMVLDAVRFNRAFAFDHPDQRQHFRDTYAMMPPTNGTKRTALQRPTRLVPSWPDSGRSIEIPGPLTVACDVKAVAFLFLIDAHRDHHRDHIADD
jgi:hypothetical protein